MTTTQHPTYGFYVIGLGAGSLDALPAINRALLADDSLLLFLRTARHPTVEADESLFARAVAFDSEYERGGSFADVYDAIVVRLLDAVSRDGPKPVLYAVPGHPLVGETTVAKLLTSARAQNIPVKIYGAPSFVDACLEAVGVALTESFALVDGLALPQAADETYAAVAPPILRTNAPILLYQVHDRNAASQAKLALMGAGYPDDFAVTIVRAAGVPGREVVREVPLHDLDRTNGHDHLTTVFVPALPADARRPGYDDLVRVMARLRRRPDGCPWDLKQTHQLLRRYLIEETYEAVEAIDDDDTDALCDELGDVLLQVVFHAQLARETDAFDHNDVCAGIVEKMIRRHPHIFGDVKADTPEQVLTNWQTIKAAEKARQSESGARGDAAAETSVLDGISTVLPALLMALETSRRAVRAGFEWPDVGGVLDKAEEEFAELRVEIEAGDVGNSSQQRIEQELGDLLFTIVNVARRLQIDPETALRRQVARFGSRFRFMERAARAASQPFDALTLGEMEILWQQAKEQEKQNASKNDVVAS